jgi:predicted anti-sigma-YlaC factor YlaD
MWTSLRLDGELSEFEGALLDAHLRSCAHCREYHAAVARAVDRLRSEPLELLGHPVTFPARRRAVVRTATLARVAALVAVAVGLVTVLSSQSTSRLPVSPLSDVAASGNSDLVQARALRIAQLGSSPGHGTQIGVHGPMLQAPSRP